MPDPQTPAIVSDDEIQAALAEAERQAARIPSLDDGRTEKVVPIPVEVPQLSPAPKEELVKAPPRPAPPPTVAPAAKTEPAAEVVPTATEHGVVYYIVDMLLGVVNWPFSWISLPARRALGFAALASMLVAVAALFVLPRLFPPRELVPRPAPRVVAAAAPAPAPAGKTEAPKAGH